MIRPGAAFTVTILWVTAGLSDWLWYGDIIRPYRRTPTGFDFDHLALDIVAARDLSNWRYKDEDELDRLVQVGALTKSDVLWIREVTQAGAREIELRPGLFALGWETWRPPESWSVPVLPTGWDRPAVL